MSDAPAADAPSGSASARRPLVPATRVAFLQLVFISLAAAFWAARLFHDPGEWLWNLDLPKIDFPLAAFFHQALADGRLPLWNGRLGLGFPLYAEGQIGAFYPPNWLLFRLPSLVALDATRVLHLAIAGVGAGMLVLRLRGSRPGAIVAALVAVLGCAITAKLEWHNMVAAYAWLPWILLPLVRRPRPSPEGLVAAGILFGIQALAGHPNTWLLTGIAFTVVLMAGRDGPVAGFRRAVGVGLLGAGVGAVQLIPTAILTTLSVRSSSLSPQDLFAASSTPFDLIFPGFSSAFIRVEDGYWNFYTVWYPDGVFAHLEAAVFLGLPVLALAAGGSTLRRSRPFLAAIAVLIAIPVFEAFQPGFLTSIPFVNGIRSPVRAYMMAAVLVGVVAGMAVGRPLRLGLRPRRSLAIALIPVIAYGATLALLFGAPDAFDDLVLQFTSFGNLADVQKRHQLAVDALTAPWPALGELAAGIAIMVVLFIAARMVRDGTIGRWRPILVPVIVLIAAAPLVAFGPLPNGTRDLASISSAGSPFMTAARGADPYRFVTLNPPGYYVGMPDQPAADLVPDLRMFSSLNLRATDDVTSVATKDNPDGQAMRRALGVDVVATFDAACPGAALTTSEPDKAVFCRDDAALRPPYWIPGAAAPARTGDASPIRPSEATVDLPTLLSTAKPATVVARDDGRVVADVDAPADGFVWVDVAWWPGWRATVDGVGVTTARAIGGTLVPVTAGTHRVELTLVPWDALLGLGIGVLALAAALVWVARGRRRQPLGSTTIVTSGVMPE